MTQEIEDEVVVRMPRGLARLCMDVLTPEGIIKPIPVEPCTRAAMDYHKGRAAMADAARRFREALE